MIQIPEVSVPELPKNTVRAPTSAEIAKQLATLQAEQEQSVNTFQAAAAPPPPAPPTQPPIPNLTTPGQVTTLQQQVELAPGSIAPIPRASNVSQVAPTNGAPMLLPVANVEGAVVAETAEGNPIIQVRTDDDALREIGLTQPGDATQPIRAPSMGGGGGFRRQRRPASPQMPMQEQIYQPSSGEEPPQMASSSAPVKVVKLG
jgi:hypothetical protein